MTYFCCEDKELLQAGIQEGELAIYTGTMNPRQPGALNTGGDSRNAYVWLWRDGQPEDLIELFRYDRTGQEVLDVGRGEDQYEFLRDQDSGYIRQISGPKRPIVLANIGAIPLRVDTFLGKFTVHAGTILRLDENAPQREKKKILLTVSPWIECPLASAEMWDGGAWRRMNIRRESISSNGYTVLDGSAIVQYVERNGKGELLMMDAPEPDPDYEIFVTARPRNVTLLFNRTDYRDGRVVQRLRTISSTSWGEAIAYDFQKLRESQTQKEVGLCIADLPGLPDIWETGPAPRERRRPLIGDELRAFLEDKEEPERPLGETAESKQEDCGHEEENPHSQDGPPGDIQMEPEGTTLELWKDFPD